MKINNDVLIYVSITIIFIVLYNYLSNCNCSKEKFNSVRGLANNNALIDIKRISFLRTD